MKKFLIIGLVVTFFLLAAGVVGAGTLLYPKVDGDDVLHSHESMLMITEYDPQKVIFVGHDRNGWGVRGKKFFEKLDKQYSVLHREGDVWRAIGLAGVDHHPFQLKDPNKSDPFVLENINWLVIEDIYELTAPFVKNKKRGPCFNVK